MQAQTTTAMSTTAELLAQYNAITVYDTQEGKDLARAIIQGDTSGKVPAKKEQILMDDCEGEYFIPAILAPKPGKLTPAQAVAPLASRDQYRPAMMCVYYDASRGAAVATCGHVLMSFPCGPLAPVSGLLHPVTLEPVKVGDVVNKIFMGTCEGNASYPDYVNVIRLPNPNGPAATLDVQSFRNQLAGIARAQRFVNLSTGIRARIQHAGQDFYVDAALCGNVLRAMQTSGTTRVNLDLSEPNRPLQFTDVNDAKKLALIMPVLGTTYGVGIAYCTVLDTAAGQVVLPTSPAPVKRVTVKKPVQPRAVQVLSKEEKKSLAAHVKQYEAASEVGQAQMTETLHENVGKRLNNLRRLAFRQPVHKGMDATYLADELFTARVGRALLATIAPPTIPAPVEPPAAAPAAIAEPVPTIPTITDLPAAKVAPARYYIWGGSGRYHINDSLAATLTEVRISKRGWSPDPQGQELAAAACRKLNAAEGREALSYQQQAVMLTPPPVPAPELSPPMPEPSQSATPGRNRRNPFYTYHAAGDRVRLLHRVGKCAVALIYPPGATVGFFALRYRQRTIEAGTYAKLTGAFAKLRAQDRAEVARLADRLSWHDGLPLASSPACLLAFCQAHGLNPDLDYRRDELSRAITSRKLPKMAHYLNALNRTTCPAN